jgi:hypothetical protein
VETNISEKNAAPVFIVSTVPRKNWYSLTVVHGVTTQKTTVWALTVVETHELIFRIDSSAC